MEALSPTQSIISLPEHVTSSCFTLDHRMTLLKLTSFFMLTSLTKQLYYEKIMPVDCIEMINIVF